MTTRKDIIREDCASAIAGNAGMLSALKEDTLLITGGTGFMGTWLAEMVTFLNDHEGFGTKLILLSSRANGFRTKVPHLASRPDVALVEKDIRSLTDVPDTVNWIIHAAGSPDSRLHASDPLRTVEVIMNGTDSALEFTTRLPDLKMFLNISSGQVYGAQPWDMPGIPEHYSGSLDSSAFGSAYAEAKRIGETLCTVYRNQYRLPIVNARPFAFIGPYQLLDRPWAINNFIRDSLAGGPIRILGDGETVRSYMYPSDMAWWLLNILARGSVGASYNVGSPHGVTLQYLAERIARRFSPPPKIVSNVAGDKGGKRTKSVPDVSLAARRLGLETKVDLDTAIMRTILWNQLDH
jgi:dTDP-glucose 4,6-dehydratase